MGNLQDAVQTANTKLNFAQQHRYECQRATTKAHSAYEQALVYGYKTAEARLAEHSAAVEEYGLAERAENAARSELQAAGQALYAELKPLREQRESFLRRLVGANSTSLHDLKCDWGSYGLNRVTIYLYKEAGNPELRSGYDVTVYAPQHNEEAKIQTSSIGALTVAELRDYLAVHQIAATIAMALDGLVGGWAVEDLAL